MMLDSSRCLVMWVLVAFVSMYLLLAIFTGNLDAWWFLRANTEPSPKQDGCTLEIFDSRGHGVWYPISDCRGLESQCNLLNPALPECGNKTEVDDVWDCYSGHVMMNCTWHPERRLCECDI